MSKQNIDIPILGIDRRLSQRQSIPGLCSVIENLEPTGAGERPYWKRAKHVNKLVNNVGVEADLPDKDKIVAAAWHVRSTVGKYGDEENPSQSLKRLVTLHDNGVVRLTDPQSPSDWREVASKDFGHEQGDSYEISFSHINNLLTFTLVKNEVSQGIYFVVDDRIIEFKIPDLPPITHNVQVFRTYSDEEVEQGLFEGIKAGSWFIQYAFELYDGTLVKYSTPRFIQQNGGGGAGNEQMFKMEFANLGYGPANTPDNLDFWEDQISGIAVLAGGHRGVNPSNNARPYDPEDLKKILFHQVTSISFKQKEVGQESDSSEASFSDKSDDWSTLRLAPVDPFTSHKLGCTVLSSYNSRLLIGGTSNDFMIPRVRSEGASLDSPVQVRASVVYGDLIDPNDPESDYEDDQILIEAPGGDLSGATTQSSFGINSIAISTTITAIIVDVSQNFGYTFTFQGWTITVTKEDFISGGYLPPERYEANDSGGDDNTTDIIVAVELETERGVFQRISGAHKAQFIPGNQNIGTLKFNGGVYTYPDRRAKKLTVWYDNSGSWEVHSVTTLTPSQTQNFSFANTSELLFQPGADAETPPPQSVNDKVLYIPNRAQVSETNLPFAFLADKTYYVGNSAGQKIVSFVTSTLAVSEGQFGQYPVYVMCSDSIWALEQSQDPLVAFARISPISLSHGATKASQVAKVGRSSAFIYQDGIFMIAGNQIVEIGEAINDYPGSSKLDFSKLVLSSRQRAGDNEFLISDGITVYVYNLRYKRWYTSGRNRSFWFANAGELYGVDNNGDIYDEFSFNSLPVAYRVRMEPVHFGAAETLKRLTAVYLRGKTRNRTLNVKSGNGYYTTHDNTLYIRGQSAYEFGVEVNGSMDNDEQYIEAITGQIEARYPHKERVYVND